MVQPSAAVQHLQHFDFYGKLIYNELLTLIELHRVRGSWARARQTGSKALPE
jgi:hypothetical protein